MWKDPLAFLVENSLHLEVLFDVQNCLLRIFNTNIRVMRHKESNSSFRDPDDKGISSTWAGEIMQGRTDVNTLVLLQQQRLILCYYESTHLYNHNFFCIWVMGRVSGSSKVTRICSFPLKHKFIYTNNSKISLSSDICW